jgi:hypothetical protein
MIELAPIRNRFTALSPYLNERERRLFAATEVAAAGYGGIAAVSAARVPVGMIATLIGLAVGLRPRPNFHTCKENNELHRIVGRQANLGVARTERLIPDRPSGRPLEPLDLSA